MAYIPIEKGQQTMVNSQPVVIASNQTSLPTTDVNLGSQTDVVATTDTGTFSLIALFKRLLQRFVTGNNNATNSLAVTQATETATGNITTQNLVPNGIATANSAVEIILNGLQTLTIQTTGTYTGVLSLQVTNNDIRWETITQPLVVNTITGVPSATIPSATIGVFEVRVSGFLKVRVAGLSAMTGTATITLRGSLSPSSVTVLNPTASTLNATVSATNLSNNMAQVGGTNTVNGGVAGTLAVGGNVAHSGASTANPLQVGGRVVPSTMATQDTTLVAGNVSYLPITPSLQAIQKLNATSELDYCINFSTSASSTIIQSLIPASGVASVRNYISQLNISTDTLGANGNVWIADGVIGGTSIATGTGLVTTSTPHDLKIGDSIMFTALNAGTGININQIYYVTSVPSTTTYTFATSIGGANVTPSVAYTTFTMYRILYIFRVQSNVNNQSIILTQPIRNIANTPISLIIPISLTSGNIQLNFIGYRGF